MKRKIVGISIFCLVLGSLFYVNHTKKVSRPNYASKSPTEDSIFHNMANENSQSQEFKIPALYGKKVKEMSILYILHIQVHVSS